MRGLLLNFLELEILACFETAGADLDSAATRQSRPLEIGVLTSFAGRVVFGSTNTVGITAYHSA